VGEFPEASAVIFSCTRSFDFAQDGRFKGVRIMRFVILLALCGCALAQTQTPWPCLADVHKTDPNTRFIRVSDGVTNKMAVTRVLPEISDLKGKELNSVVVVEVLAGRDGRVLCTRIQQGDADLAQRSLDAAQKWHYKPCFVNGEKLIVNTWIRFSYSKDNVEVLLPIQ
jgi:Gram-negative bacterial TonB protein C-terminal